MTTESTRTDQLLRELLARRAAHARVDALLAEIVQAAAETPQHRLWPPPLQWPTIPRHWFVFAPLVIAVATLGVLVAVPTVRGPAGLPTPPPSATPSPSTSPAIPSLRGGGLGAPTLQAGRYLTSEFEPPLLITLPDRIWAPIMDAERQLLLRARLPGVAASENDALTLVTITNVYDNPCADGADRPIPWTSGSEPAAFLDWLETELSFDFGPRTARTILDRPALEVDFVAPSLAECREGFLAITNAMWGEVNPFGPNQAGQPARYTVFELNGQTVLVGIWTTDPARRDLVSAAADAVLESLEIAP